MTTILTLLDQISQIYLRKTNTVFVNSFIETSNLIYNTNELIKKNERDLKLIIADMKTLNSMLKSKKEVRNKQQIIDKNNQLIRKVDNDLYEIYINYDTLVRTIRHSTPDGHPPDPIILQRFIDDIDGISKEYNELQKLKSKANNLIEAAENSG